jgi:hypothetical protein
MFIWGEERTNTNALTRKHVMKPYGVSPNSPVVRHKAWYFNSQRRKKQKVTFSTMKKFLTLDTGLMVIKPKCICLLGVRLSQW